jgi:hypothetical protein
MKLKNIKLILTLFFLLNNCVSFAQIDSLILRKINSFNEQDTLIIDIKNFYCKGEKSDRVVIYYNKKNEFSLMSFLNFNVKTSVDGMMLNDIKKQQFRCKKGDFFTHKITLLQLHNLVNELNDSLITTNLQINVAGYEYSQLDINLSGLKYSTKTKHWLEINCIKVNEK